MAKPVKRHDTAVILHLYYPDAWDQILDHLSSLGKAFDLFVTIPVGVSFSEDTIRERFPDAQIYRCENRGRDVAPFLAVFSAISALGYKYICKIHSKKSLHISNGIEWREDMLRKLLGSPKTVLRIKKAFDRNSSWGLIAPRGHVVPWEYFWKLNAEHVTELARAAGIPTEAMQFNFVAGSMFWFRPEALSLVLKVSATTQDFEPEQGQQDGTLAHAFERFFGLAAKSAGYEIAESNGQEVGPAEISFHFHLVIEALTWQVTAMQTSLSWRLTKPLRWGKAKLGQFLTLFRERDAMEKK